MNDAEAQLAERLAGDLERVLRTGIAIQDLEIDGDGPVTIRIACLSDGRAHDIVATGDSVVEALADVIRKAAETRLTGAFWQIVGPT
jgi:hypothetical protein